MMFIRNGIVRISYQKRAVNCITQHMKRHYVTCQSWYKQQNKENKHFSLPYEEARIPNHYYSDNKQCTLCSQQFSYHKIGWKNYHQLHNISQVQTFCAMQKQTVTKSPSPASVNEHWGPYLVSRIHRLEESSRFHGYSTLRWGLSIIVTALAGVYLFRDKLRDNVADEVADVASRSMADENVLLKAHDMTKGVLERLASEADTITLVSEFLKAVLQQNEVKNAVVAFATSVLNHPETQEKVQEIVRITLHSILNDKETKELMLEFIKNLIEDQQTKETCNLFLTSLTKDADIQKMVSEFFKSVLASPSFQMEAASLGREVTNRVVHDKDIQKQTGDALWSAMKYGVTPHWFRSDK